MEEIFGCLMTAVEAQQDTVLVTVIASAGSTPRSEGAKMLISASGRLTGTIGGGGVEFRSEQIAQTVLLEQKGRIEKFTLAPNDAADLGMLCGGKVELLFQYLAWQQPQLLTLCQRAVEQLQQKQQCWLIMPIKGEAQEPLGFYSKSTGWLGYQPPRLGPQKLPIGTAMYRLPAAEFYTEELLHPGKVYIFGAGHVAQALVPVLERLDFVCAVVDDRPQLLQPGLFSEYTQRWQIDFSRIAATVQLTEYDYALVMTHMYDLLTIKQLLKTPARYLGVMASRHKVGILTKELQQQGVAAAAIKAIHMPIGLKIKAETPAELAISIAGELIAERAEKMTVAVRSEAREKSNWRPS